MSISEVIHVIGALKLRGTGNSTQPLSIGPRLGLWGRLPQSFQKPLIKEYALNCNEDRMRIPVRFNDYSLTKGF